MDMEGYRVNKYPRGYKPKIEFWANELLKASREEESKYSMEYMLGKLRYFIEKESERTKSL
jgi:hypothetical protein